MAEKMSAVTRKSSADDKLKSLPNDDTFVRGRNSYVLSTSYLRTIVELRTGSALDRLSANIAFEVERGLAFNLIPVLLGVGICVYFSIPEEPNLWFMAASTFCLLIISKRMPTRGFAYCMTAAILVVIAGMSAAKTAVLRTGSPTITGQLTTEISGIILKVDTTGRGAPRYLLRPTSIKDWHGGPLPKRIRLSATSKKVRFLPGEAIGGLARMQPVLGPVYPGGYDYSFFSRFEGLGGSGFFMGPPKKEELTNTDQLNIFESFMVGINASREKIGQRIQRNVVGTSGKIATALVIGDKTGIPQHIQEALRATGLAHILAISGLHMALVTLTVVWIIRAVFAFSPGMPLKFAVKKWAAASGLIFATIYLLMSGMGVATQRAWIMICVMLLAVLADRKAITMRSVAISAIIILSFQPQNILAPGFQMSFAAVISLVAAYCAITEWRQKRVMDKVEADWVPKYGLFRTPFVYFGGIATTSLVAGAATSVIAAWHFQQFAPYGLLANILAMPIVSTIIMPAVLFSIVLMPFGLEFIPLYPVAWGIDQVVAIAFWVQGLGPAKVTGVLPISTILLFLTGLLILTQFRTRLRFAAIVPLISLPVLLTEPKVPDVLIAESGRSVVIKDSYNKLLRLYPKRENFITVGWAKAYGGGATRYANYDRDKCNSDRCISVLPSSLVLHVVYDPKLLPSSCLRSDILVAPRLRWVNCNGRVPRLILKRGDFEKRGSHAVYVKRTDDSFHPGKRNDHEVSVTTAFGQPTRPWHRQSND